LVLPQCATVDDLRQAIAPFVPDSLSSHPQLLVLLAKAALSHYPLPTFAIAVAEGLLTEAAASVAGKSDLPGWDETEKRFVRGKLTLLSHRYSEAAPFSPKCP